MPVLKIMITVKDGQATIRMGKPSKNGLRGRLVEKKVAADQVDSAAVHEAFRSFTVLTAGNQE